MRKLASIQRIVKLEPIEGADLIQKATVLNWQLVTAKDNGFNEGDLAIYIEPDAWVPHTVAPFLSKGQDPREYNGVKGEKLRTIKLRGQISQGLLIPLFYSHTEHSWCMPREWSGIPVLVEEGQDVTELLNIQKWEAPISAQLQGQIKGNWPDGIPKTDEDRIQTFKNSEFEELKQYAYEITEKLEGSSMTVGMVNGEFIVCSRNMNLKEVEGNTFWKMAREYDIEAKMIAAGLDNLVFQGELIGEGIQGNHYGLKGHKFAVFSVYDISKGQYLLPSIRRDIVSKMMLHHVPVLVDPLNLHHFTSVQEVIEYADGAAAYNQQKHREGIVFKRHDGPQHFKAVSAKYLLKKGE